MNSGEREALLGFGRFTLDLGVGLRTRRRGNVTGFAVAGLAVGATLTQLATLGQPIPDDASLPTTRRHFPVVAPEVTIGAQWWPRRWISLGLAATYSPTWVHGELLHVSDTLATLALAL